MPFVPGPESQVNHLPHCPGCGNARFAMGVTRVHQKGFTLLEIMVVVILISITVTLVSINLDRDLDQVAHQEALRFAKLLEHVREESILTGKSYAVEIDENKKSYRFMESADGWKPVKGDDLLRKRLFPEFLSVKFDALQGSAESDGGRVIVQGLGDVTPFQLVVSGDNYLHVVKLDDAFNVIVDRVARDAT
ncbi:Tfp pilus assembly protein FimT/FimU [Pseudomonadota bacterium]